LAKVWFSFAEWSLSLGEKILADCKSEGGKIKLTSEETAALNHMLPEEDRGEIADMLSRVQLLGPSGQSDMTRYANKLLRGEKTFIFLQV